MSNCCKQLAMVTSKLHNYILQQFALPLQVCHNSKSISVAGQTILQIISSFLVSGQTIPQIEAAPSLIQSALPGQNVLARVVPWNVVFCLSRSRDRKREGASHPESALSTTEHDRVGCDSPSESVLFLMERLLGADALPSLACYCGCTYLEEFLEDHKVGCCAGGGGEDQILRLS
jgi:hypothetical protein